YGDYVPFATARDLFVEMAYYGPEVLRFADGFKEVVEQHDALRKEGKLAPEALKAMEAAKAYFANYDAEVDKRVFKALLPIYRKHMPAHLLPPVLKEVDTRYRGDTDAWLDAIYAR